ncbi:MAG: hypothetical protein M5U34_27855 [Chloroflexi bacterium]|nr:hypothetical protein [Chloroflexota bacterium]
MEGKEPPLPDKEPEYYLKLLSKAFGLRGRMVLDTYVAAVVEFRDTHLHLDPEDRQKLEFTWQEGVIDTLLKEAAVAYVKGIACAQLLSPRSQTLSLIYDFIYHRARKMNPQELDKFSYYVSQAQKIYKIDELKLENLGNASNFLAECFGEYPGLEFPNEDGGE